MWKRQKANKFICNIIVFALIFMILGQSLANAKVIDLKSKINIKIKEINYGKMIRIEDVEYFIDKVNEYINENPNATEEEINDFIKKEMEKKYLYNNENILYDNINGLSYPAPVSLNPKEQELYNKNPFKGLKAIWQGKKAMDETEKRYSEGLHNGNGDAFRHAYWNAMMVKHIDYNWALDWATAHEEGAVGQPSIEKEMDLYNNEVGRKAVLGKESKSDTEIADIIQGMVRNGKMKRIVNNKLVNTNSEGERR